MKENAAYTAWYNLGYWFHKPGYYYRNINEDYGVYCASGTYPGCERGCAGKSLESLIEQGYKPISVKTLITLSGFRPDAWIIPLNDGSVNFDQLWTHLLETIPYDDKGGVTNPFTNARVCREYYESK